MAAIEISPDLHLIPLDQKLTGFVSFIGAWLYQGDKTFLVDVGPAATIPDLLTALETLRIRKLDAILLTHIHIDHAGGIGHLAAQYPDTPIICHKSGIKHLADPSKQWVRYSPQVIAAICLLLLTGCRLREILNLRWSEVDLERGLLLLRDSKTGRKTVILNRAAISVLDSLDRAGACVIPGDDLDRPRHDLKRPWDHIRAAAQLNDVRLHDLRHTHASIGAGAGFGLPVVGRLLGHASAATTQRYAHIADDPARRASEAIGAHLAEALNRGDPNS
jgi:integrase